MKRSVWSSESARLRVEKLEVLQRMSCLHGDYGVVTASEVAIDVGEHPWQRE